MRLTDLERIDVYKLHPELLPFVGSEYEKYRVLHIGESHYIGQDKKKDNEKYDIKYFDKWWSESCEELTNEFGGWFNTRQVIENYLTSKNSKAYTIFTNVIKSFSKIVLKEDIKNITYEKKQIYNYFAFMNFFQMPSIYEGEKYWNSLWRSAKRNGDKQLAYDMWEKAVKESIRTVDKVIEILEPKAIIFTSISAGCAYKENGGKYKDEKRVVYTSHPGYPYTWNKGLKSLDNKTGKECLEDKLKTIY